MGRPSCALVSQHCRRNAWDNRVLVAGVALVLAGVLVPTLGANPIVPDVGMADPHIHFFNGTFWLFSTHDYSANNTGFLMKDWWTWSSPDLVNWKLRSILTPNDTASPPGAWNECWATDGAERDGEYFFYLSYGPNQVGVVNSSSPAGPWDNILGVPMLPASLGSSLDPPTTIRDPCVFADDDGTQYIIFGTFNYFIAKLSEDMISLAEAPHYIVVNNPTGPYGNSTDDKPFLHKYNGMYYLSWGCFYGMSTSPYGPFNYTGSVVDTQFIAPSFRMNVTVGPWYSWEDYADRHGSFWTAFGQWYYACNDRSHSTDIVNPSYFRDTVISYVHYFSNGSIAPVVINGTGVGTYDASYVEAENFFALENAYKGHTEAGEFGVYGITNQTMLVYPHIRNVPESPMLYFRAANGNVQPTRILVWRKEDGRRVLLGEAIVHPIASWGEFLVSATQPLPLGSADADVDVTLVLTFQTADDSSEGLRLDAFWMRGVLL